MARDLKVYEYVKDYALAGKKVGDRIKLANLPRHLLKYLKEVDGVDAEDRPTDKWKKDDIITWLDNNGVPDAKGNKDELLALVAEL